MRKFAPDANGYEKRLERLGSSRFSLSISAVDITDTTSPGVRPQPCQGPACMAGAQPT